MTLLTDDRRLRLCEIGRRFVTLSQPTAIPPGPASVVATIDANVQYWSVVIPEGLDPDEKEVPLPTLIPENRHDGPPPGWENNQ